MKKRGLHKDPPIQITQTPGGLKLDDHVVINRPGWYGHGDTGKIVEIHHGIYVRITNGECYRMLESNLRKVEKPGCQDRCCTNWREGPIDGNRKVLREEIQDL